jgi:two-component system OmpR family sensor kinase
MKKSRAGPRLGPPIALQIIGLLVAVLIVGQLATLAVVMVSPPPRPPVYRIEDVAMALKGGRVIPRYAPPLIRTFASEPPKQRMRRDFRGTGMAMELARLLNVPDDQVRLTVEAHPHFVFSFFPGVRLGDGMREPPPGPRTDMLPPDHQGLDRQGRDQASTAPPPPLNTIGPRGGRPENSGPQDAGGGPWDRSEMYRRPWFGHRPGSSLDHWGLLVGHVEAAYQTAPGRWTIVRTTPEGFPNAWQQRVGLWFLACLCILTPIGYLFARRLTAPIGRFASAAERLGRDPRAPAMALSGPAEIGLAATAFNEMQARLARYVEDRTAMIGAIAHDLRTPLARVQFKLQRAPDDLASDIRADLGQMEAMIAAVLAFVRDVAPMHERAPLDLLSLLEVVADDAGATGADVELESGPAAIVEGDASALQRLFVNLVDNAVKYGGQARISLALEGDDIVVKIADRGPGIPDQELDRVFEPFYRVETSRSRETGGIGLGLSVARSISRAHGGDVTLVSGAEGLTAVVRLPGASRRRII